MDPIKQSLRAKKCKQKKTYFSKETADAVASRYSHLTSYHCDICGHYHLTSQAYKLEKKNRKVKVKYTDKGAIGNRKKKKAYFERLQRES